MGESFKMLLLYKLLIIINNNYNYYRHFKIILINCETIIKSIIYTLQSCYSTY